MNPTRPISSETRHQITLAICLAVVMSMTGMAYAAVPLYRLFCQLTGYGGTTQVASDAKEITVRFDSNVAPGLPWSFRPETPSLKLRVGETVTVFYRISNISAKETVGRAAYNVQPDRAGAYFDKIQCFCFSDLALKPGESLDVPVMFFIDPAIESESDLARIDAITLSYTFFAAKGAQKPVAELTGTTKPQL